MFYRRNWIAVIVVILGVAMLIPGAQAQSVIPFFSKTLHWFSGTDGERPVSLIQASDFLFYGTTEFGGASNLGTVFRLDGNGDSFMTLHEFVGTDGIWPNSLIQASDGLFYGTTYSGGFYPIQSGTIFAGFSMNQLGAAQAQLKKLNVGLSSGLTSVENDFRIVFKNPGFVLPGSPNLTQYQNLIGAILNLTKGEKRPIYQRLSGK